MYQVFNMGCRMEVYTDEKSADDIISTAQNFGIDAQVIGRVEAADRQCTDASGKWQRNNVSFLKFQEPIISGR
jgi:phosphoribosylformylglycinamidine cyclo-ligase